MNAPFYVYVFASPEGVPFYVGKGRGRRFLVGGNRHSKAKIRLITERGEKVRLTVLPFDSETEAFAKEKELISLYGRLDLNTGTLCNFSDGGEGSANPSPEAREKNRQAKLGDKNPMKRSGVRATNSGMFRKGRVRSLEERQNHSLAMKGRKFTEEHRRKLSLASRGNKNCLGRTWKWKRNDEFDSIPHPHPHA